MNDSPGPHDPTQPAWPPRPEPDSDDPATGDTNEGAPPVTPDPAGGPDDDAGWLPV